MQQQPQVLIKHLLYAWHILSHLILTILWRDELYGPTLEMRKQKFQKLGWPGQGHRGWQWQSPDAEVCLAPRSCSLPRCPSAWPESGQLPTLRMQHPIDFSFERFLAVTG